MPPLAHCAFLCDVPKVFGYHPPMTTKRPSSKKKAPTKRYASYRGNPNYRGKRRGLVRGLVSWVLRLIGRIVRGLFWFLKTRVAKLGMIVGALALIYFIVTLPDIREIDTIRKQQGITIQTEDGRTVANYGDVYGEYLPYDKLPKSLIYAVVATEDRRFFEHHGVDIFGIARAMVINVINGHVVQGGSTVTQQVAKNVFLTPERSIARKIQELLLAFWLEGRFSKKEIMAIYLNRVYLGSGAFGVDAASRRYFNKSARDLTMEESALLAGLLKAPSRYSPAANSTRAKERMHQVLLNMQDAGFIKKKQVESALANYAKTVQQRPTEGGDIRYYTDWVMDQIPELVGQVEEDLVVVTPLDTAMQAQAADALQNVVSTEGPKKNVSQGAVVAMRPDGAVLAMIGGLNYGESQYNRAAQAKRQPGSVFKLFVYLAALEAGMTPLSTVEDAPITLQAGNKTWSPDNYDENNYLGEIPMVQALRNSLNTVSVRLSQYAGIGRVAEMAMRLGIPNVPAYPSIALGAVEATLLEMTGAYSHLANGGKKVEPYGILTIRNRKGKELYKREVKEEPPQLLANGTVEMMNYMLLDVVARGTGTKARLANRQVAGKTGTSQDFKDAWFIGFTPQLVAGVWVGNDDNKPMKRITGGSIPATVWHGFMTNAMQGVPAKPIPNSAASSDGLFPWLFGGEAKPESGEGNATPAQDIPADAPFGLAHPPEHSTVDEPAPAAPVDEPAAAAPTPAAQDAEALPPQFWDKLMEKVPEKSKVKVEYSYPSDKSH